MKKKEGVNTFLGHGVRFEGELEFEGTVRVDGQVKGTITSKDGVLVVGEKALVEGDVRVGKIIVAGSVRGGIAATVSVEIQKSGQVTGDIQSPSVTIDSGALFHGNCVMEKPAGSQGPSGQADAKKTDKKGRTPAQPEVSEKKPFDNL